MLYTLAAKRQEGTLRVGILGLGKTGHPLAARFAQNGVPAVGFSTRPATVEMTNNGSNHSFDPYLPENMRRLVFDDLLHGSTDFFYVVRHDVLFVCLDDMAEEWGNGEGKTARHYAEGIGAALQKGTAVVFIVSGEEEIPLASLTQRIKEKSGLCPDKDFTTAMIDKATAVSINPNELLAFAVGEE